MLISSLYKCEGPILILHSKISGLIHRNLVRKHLVPVNLNIHVGQINNLLSRQLEEECRNEINN